MAIAGLAQLDYSGKGHLSFFTITFVGGVIDTIYNNYNHTTSEVAHISNLLNRWHV